MARLPRPRLQVEADPTGTVHARLSSSGIAGVPGLLPSWPGSPGTFLGGGTVVSHRPRVRATRFLAGFGQFRGECPSVATLLPTLIQRPQTRHSVAGHEIPFPP